MRVKFITLDINDANVNLFSLHLNVMNILSLNVINMLSVFKCNVYVIGI